MNDNLGVPPSAAGHPVQALTAPSPTVPDARVAERLAQEAELADYMRSRYPLVGDPDAVLTAFMLWCEGGDDHIDPRSFASISGDEEWGEGLEAWCAGWTVGVTRLRAALDSIYQDCHQTDAQTAVNCILETTRQALDPEGYAAEMDGYIGPRRTGELA